jgi:hypothetical protein
MLTELDIVNACLASIGQAPRTSLARPDRYTSAIVALIKKSLKDLQETPWWFNTRLVDVTPDETNDWRVDDQLPCNVLDVVSSDGEPLAYQVPGILVSIPGGETIKTKRTIKCVFELNFQDLPHAAQAAVHDAVVLKFHEAYGSGDRQHLVREAAGSALRLRIAQDRHYRTNLLHRPLTAYNVLRARGSRPYIRY